MAAKDGYKDPIWVWIVCGIAYFTCVFVMLRGIFGG